MKKLCGMAWSLLVAMLSSSAVGAWTISQNFDGQSAGASCGWDAGGGSTVSSAMAYSGSKSCQLSVNAGDTAFGTWGGIIYHPTNLTRGDQIWVRVRTYMPNGFNYDSTSGGNRLKFLRVHTMSPSSENLGYDDIYINPKGTDPPFNFIYEGEQVWSLVGTLSASLSLSGISNAIVLGTWETYEYYVKLDTVPVSKGGTAEVRFWKNGILISDIKDRITLSSTDAYSDRTHLFTYWNGGAPATEKMYVDDLVITSDTPSAKDAAGHPFIGTGGSAVIPTPPSGITIQ